MRGLRARTEPAVDSPRLAQNESAGAASGPLRFYSVAQAAELLGMSPMTLYRAITAREFPAVRVRGRLIIPAKAIEAMVDLAVGEQTVVDAAGWVPQRVASR